MGATSRPTCARGARGRGDRGPGAALGRLGADTLPGTVGPNVIEGRAGLDRIFALEGDDTVLVRDRNPDTADCGPGNDRATVDPGGIDVTIACESVSVGVAPGLPGASGTGGVRASARRRAVAGLTGPRSQKLVRGALTLRLVCPVLSCAARATASTRFRLGAGPRRHRVTLLPARARILAGKSALLRLRLAPRGLAKVNAALTAGRRPAVRVTVVVTDAAAATAQMCSSSGWSAPVRKREPASAEVEGKVRYPPVAISSARLRAAA